MQFANTTLNHRPYEDATPVSACIVPDLKYFYYTIFTLSILGNGLVLFVLIKFERACTVNNILLSNLLASNLVFTCTVPIWAVYQRRELTFSPALCKLVGMATYVGFHSSVLFLTLVTIHRYLAVVHAVAMYNQPGKNRYAVVASGVVWLTCGLAGVAPLIRYKVYRHWESGWVCVDEQDPSWMLFNVYLHFVAFFLLPLLVVVYCYVRIIITLVSEQISGKNRSLRVVFVILLLFFSCWTPRSVMHLVTLHTHYDCNNSVDYANYVTNNIAWVYFSINPVFYAFLGRKFKNYMCELIGSSIKCPPVCRGHELVTVPSQPSQLR
ncbi:C-C chemokine receptor type 8-like [Engraulis encrasicolus]|uniref:C-C chemokine receptor type 8-like n=1 Tax=Engraulis encrasicolus TaxID=184585 RepID=UPI002FD5C701